MLLILCKYENPRLKYVLDEIFLHRLQLAYKTTENEDYFIKSVAPKIAYTDTLFKTGINIPAVNLLYEEEVFKQVPDIKDDTAWHKILFPKTLDTGAFVEAPRQHLGFDLFAAIFYLLSRYEEYLPHKKDLHGRFSAEHSFAFQNGFLEYPLIDHWIIEFKKLLSTEYPDLIYTPAQTRFIPSLSYDLDFPYKYKGISPWRNIKKAVGNILRWDIPELKTQVNVQRGKAKDPFDTYDLIINKHAEKNVAALFFFLLADRESRHDKNPSPKSKQLRSLLSGLSSKFLCGLHPSYQSNINAKRLENELRHFKDICAKPAIIARFHFLKIHLPFSYRLLLNHGIQADYSMAWSTHCGFRASTSLPFRFFDLPENKISDLLIHPCCIMDVSLKNFMLLHPQQAIEKIKELKAVVRKVKGNFISIWHNSSLAEGKEWKGWRPVWEELFD